MKGKFGGICNTALKIRVEGLYNPTKLLNYFLNLQTYQSKIAWQSYDLQTLAKFNEHKFNHLIIKYLMPKLFLRSSKNNNNNNEKEENFLINCFKLFQGINIIIVYIPLETKRGKPKALSVMCISCNVYKTNRNIF